VIQKKPAGWRVFVFAFHVLFCGYFQIIH
jgi:hypothetical protein